jgi:hypothetical protein
VAPGSFVESLLIEITLEHVDYQTADGSILPGTALDIGGGAATDREHAVKILGATTDEGTQPDHVFVANQVEAEITTRIGGNAFVLAEADKIGADRRAVTLRPANHRRRRSPEDPEHEGLTTSLQSTGRHRHGGQGNQHTQGKKQNLFHVSFSFSF